MNPRLIIAIALLLSLTTSTPSQTLQSEAATDTRARRKQVTASASAEKVRFAALGELIEIRLQVISSSGEVTYESDFKPGNALDWTLKDKKGQPIADGSYLCVVTVQDLSGQIGRWNAQLNRQDQAVTLSRTDRSTLAASQADALGEPSNDDEHLMLAENGRSTSTAVIAHDGITARVVSGGGGLSFGGGDFFANKVLEHLRITAEGNVGIGVANPEAKLDVAGLIRASRGIVFPDGSVQFSAARKTFGTESQKPGQFGKSPSGQEHFEPKASGTGTQDRLAKWVDNVGALGDSGIVEVNGNIGIGTTSPQSGLDYRSPGAAFFARDLPTNPGNAVSALQLGLSNVGSRFAGVGPSFLFFGENSAGAKSFLGRVSGVWENPTAGAEAGSIFFQVRANSGDVNALTERMRITSIGNVGIGTPNPLSRLHVLGASSSSATAIGVVESTGNQVPLSFRINGTEQARIRSDTSGNLTFATLNGGSKNLHFRAGDDSTSDLFIQSLTDHVGIGTLAPVSRLDVTDAAAGQIRFGRSATDTGGFLVSANPSEGTLSGGARWNGSAWVSGTLQTETSMTSMDSGEIRFFTDAELTPGAAFTPTRRMTIGETGRVGIGTLPQNFLDVLGEGTFTGGILGSSEVVARFKRDTTGGNSAISIDSSSGRDSILYLAEQGAARWDIRNDANEGDIFKIRSQDSDGTSATRLTIERNGSVGIGTTTPDAKLDVNGSLRASGGLTVVGSSDNGQVATITNDGNTNNADVLVLVASPPNEATPTNNYITFRRFEENIGAIQGDNLGGISLVSGSGDYAEWLPRLNPAEQIQPGDVIGLYGGRTTKHTRGASKVMAVTSNPIVVGNDPGEQARAGYERVAFIGQVPVRVRGTVQAGDFIIASGLNDGIGVAVSPECISSEQFEQAVGQAWESSADPGVKPVRTAVGLIQRDPTVSRLIESNRNQAARIAKLDARIAAIEVSMKKKFTSRQGRATGGKRLSGVAAAHN